MQRTNATQQEQEEAILAAAVAEFASMGVRGANVERIAQQAQVSRSTLYRRFPSKEDLLTAVGARMQADFMRGVAGSVDGLDPRAAVVEAFTQTIEAFRTNPLARRLIADEPEALDLLIGFERSQSDAVIDSFSDAIAHTLRKAGASMPAADLRLAAELQIRLVASFATSRSRALDLTDAVATRQFAEKFLAPMIW